MKELRMLGAVDGLASLTFYFNRDLLQSERDAFIIGVNRIYLHLPPLPKKKAKVLKFRRPKHA